MGKVFDTEIPGGLPPVARARGREGGGNTENQYRKWLGEKRGKEALRVFGEKCWKAYRAETA
jgi:hypothetical protein